jgi:hypothetical protein
MTDGGFYFRTPTGRLICHLCGKADREHTPECVVRQLHAQLRELTVQLGQFVTTVHETVEALDAHIRGATTKEVRDGSD